MDIVFLHIPKTGGTSLRTFLLNHLTEHRPVFDYGPNSPATNKHLLEKYASNEKIDLRAIFSPREKLFVSGHVMAAKYLDQFSPMSFISVVREPFERIVSLYSHISRKTGFSKELSRFIREKKNINGQHRVLSGLDISHSGLVFTMENYDYGVELIKDHFNIPAGLPAQQNKGNYSNIFKDEIERFREEFVEMNELDYRLFNSINSRRAIGRFAEEPGTVGPVRGTAHVKGEDTIVGWLVSTCGKGPLSYEVLICGQKRGEGVADIFRADVRRKGIAAHGVCGFSLKIDGASLNKLRPDQIVIREKNGSNFEMMAKPGNMQ